MNILDKIVIDKRKEVASKKLEIPISDLEKGPFFDQNTISMVNLLQKSKSGIIAEHKRKSPSKSVINENLNIQYVAQGYENAGVCGMSVLTDSKYFGGSLEDLQLARAACQLPLLRKEFIIDEYQIIEAKANGADVILLIAAILSTDKIKQFSQLAKSLNLNVLLEVHSRNELQNSIMPSLDMLGVNNRNLKSFEVNLDTSKLLSEYIPSDFVKVSESGINSINAIKELQLYGYQGFLIGENFMKTNDPGTSAAHFITQLES